MTDRATPNLPARDFAATSRFYRALGFVERWRDEQWMILDRGNCTLEFFLHAEVDPLTSWFSCCVRVDDLDGLYAACLAAGLAEGSTGTPRLHPPAKQSWGSRMAALIDLDGTLLRLIENPRSVVAAVNQADAERFMREAIALARSNVAVGGRPFGAVVVADGQVVANAVNEIQQSGDPTAHAELIAIRRASQKLGTTDLGSCTVYASGHPCPMCLASMHLCGIGAAYFAYSNEEGEPYGLSTAAVYAQMAEAPSAQRIRLRPLRPDGEQGLYAEWKQRQTP